MEIKAAKVTTTIKHKETGEIYKTEEEWKAKGIEEKDIRRDVHVLMPSLDLFGKTKQVENLGEIMTKSHRQRYGFGSFIKKITRPVKKVAKKVLKSPLGKAALIGGGLYGLGGLQSLGGSGMFKAGQGLSRFGNLAKIFKSKGMLGDLLYSGEGKKRKFSLGKAGLLGLGAAGTILQFYISLLFLNY